MPINAFDECDECLRTCLHFYINAFKLYTKTQVTIAYDMDAYSMGCFNKLNELLVNCGIALLGSVKNVQFLNPIDIALFFINAKSIKLYSTRMELCSSRWDLCEFRGFIKSIKICIKTIHIWKQQLTPVNLDDLFL